MTVPRPGIRPAKGGDGVRRRLKHVMRASFLLLFVVIVGLWQQRTHGSVPLLLALTTGLVLAVVAGTAVLARLLEGLAGRRSLGLRDGSPAGDRSR